MFNRPVLRTWTLSTSLGRGLSRSLCKSHFSYRYPSILDRTPSPHGSWLRTWDQPAWWQPSPHLRYGSSTLRYSSFITASSLGNDPRLTTLRKPALTESRALVVYMTRLTSEPQEKSCHTWSRLRSHTATAPG